MTEQYEIIDMLSDDENVLVAKLMDDEFKKDVLEYEMKRLDELVPFINKGMDDAFKEKEALVLVRKHSQDIKPQDISNESSFTLRTEGGDVIGETIFDEEELEELRNDPNVYFLSDNFVTYQNKAKPGQKQFFVMEAESSNFVTDKDIKSTVSSIKVAVPSTETDHFIKDYYDIAHDESIGTVIIGFTPKDD